MEKEKRRKFQQRKGRRKKRTISSRVEKTPNLRLIEKLDLLHAWGAVKPRDGERLYKRKKKKQS